MPPLFLPMPLPVHCALIRGLLILSSAAQTDAAILPIANQRVRYAPDRHAAPAPNA